MTKFGLKALGLCLLAALSVMAFAAVGAQANPGHVWVLTTPNGEKVLLTETVSVKESQKAINGLLLSTFGAGETPIIIHCKAILIHDGLLFTTGASLGELLFSSCQTLISGLEKANCKPLEPIVSKVKNLLLHHNNETYILFSPHDLLTFATLHLGELCAAGENIQVKGNLKAECGLLHSEVWTHLDCKRHKVVQWIRQALPYSLFPNHGLSFGTKPATLDGDVPLVLSSATHVGKEWGVEALLP